MSFRLTIGAVANAIPEFTNINHLHQLFALYPFISENLHITDYYRLFPHSGVARIDTMVFKNIYR